MKSKDELLELLTENVEDFNQYIEDNKENGIDMSELDLSGVNVEGAVFINVDLSASSLADSNLVDVKFENSDLTSADFTHANLAECSFASSILNGTDFSYSVLDYCNFHEADMAGSIFQESDLTNSDLTTSYNLHACRFDDSTVWPDADMLPEGFDGVYSDDLSSLKDDEEIVDQDY